LARDHRRRERSQEACAEAVAYFGAGSSGRLPLPSGSCLVVDASDYTVSGGLTCPADLEKLLNRGVDVYRVSNLHAKVFVLGGRPGDRSCLPWSA